MSSSSYGALHTTDERGTDGGERTVPSVRPIGIGGRGVGRPGGGTTVNKPKNCSYVTK